MSEKKRIDFISGTAFLLSVLALFLIGINAIQGTPSEEALQKVMEEQFAGFSRQLDVQMQSGMKQIEDLKGDLRQQSDDLMGEMRQQRVTAMRQVLESLQKDVPADLQEHVDKVDAALTELENAIAGPVPEIVDEEVQPVEE